MHEWLAWARGPLFHFAILFMFLGIFRLVILNIVSFWLALRQAGDQTIPYRRIFRETIVWLAPFGKIPGRKSIFAIVSMTFHIAVIVTPIFLGAHVLLWKRGVGLAWPVISNYAADVLTIVGIIAGLLILWERIFSRNTRTLSRTQDYVLLILLIATFFSGYLAMHPQQNPFFYDSTMFVHVMAGNAIICFLPFSKLSHAILFPFNQLVSELGWHLVPGAGHRVAVSLGKENKPV